MDKHAYVVTCNADPTCIVVADDEEMAVKMAKKQADEDIGECDDNWKSFEINDYFSGESDSYFFGWVKHADQNYI
jgi:hypothetical protein